MHRKKKHQYQGGYKQRLAQAMADSEPDDVPDGSSFLAKTLVEKWAWGLLSTPQVQEIAHGAFRDGLTHSQVKQLASLGSWGKCPGNMQRDMMQAIGSDCALTCSTSEVQVNLLGPKGNWPSAKLNMLLPHKLFSKMYHARPAAFLESVLGGTEDNIKAFWKAMKEHPVVQARPELRGRTDLSKVVPIAIHGDGVAYMQLRSGGKTLEVLSWSSLLSTSPTKTGSFLIFLVVKSLVKETGFGRSWPVSWRVVIWSLQALFASTWPQRLGRQGLSGSHK